MSGLWGHHPEVDNGVLHTWICPSCPREGWGLCGSGQGSLPGRDIFSGRDVTGKAIFTQMSLGINHRLIQVSAAHTPEMESNSSRICGNYSFCFHIVRNFMLGAFLSFLWWTVFLLASHAPPGKYNWTSISKKKVRSHPPQAWLLWHRVGHQVVLVWWQEGIQYILVPWWTPFVNLSK